MKKIGLIDSDIVSLIKYKKYSDTKSVCNQLSMVDDFYFHDFWFQLKGVNKELYWEMQYLWKDEYYFHTGYFKEKMWKCIKKLKIKSFLFYFFRWIMWSEIVKDKYYIYVQLPFSIRNNTLDTSH